MATFKRITDDLSVAPQISIADVAEAARSGFRAIINNRPDGEEPGQPTSAEIEAAAREAGLGYSHIPVRGSPGPAEIEAMREIVDAADGPILAFCRSGTRSIVTWALGEAASGALSHGEIVQLGRVAGYDLSGLLGG